MAVSKRRQGYWWSRVHFLLRLLGLTGVMLLAAGVGLAYLNRIPPRYEPMLEALRGAYSGWDQVAIAVIVGGGIAALLALAFELFSLVFLTVGRRSLSGTSALIQAVLAVAIVAGVNYYSFSHYLRSDWTRASDFTLPQNVQDDLRKLKGEVTVVVYQHDRSFGQSDKTDRRAIRTAAYDDRAKEKVVEKVKDLVEQFREFGPQFHVELLNVKDENYEARLEQVAHDRPELRRAIDDAEDNTIFFYRPAAGGQAAELGQLAFNDFYQLDKTASQEQKNLVLLPQGDKAPPPPPPGGAKLDHKFTQGVEPFARKVLSLGEPRPRIALGVIHPYLSSEGPVAEWRLKAARKALEAQGFDVKDVILRKWDGGRPGEFDAITAEERKLDEKERETAGLRRLLRVYDQVLNGRQATLDYLRKATLDELARELADELQGRRLTEEDRQTLIKSQQEGVAVVQQTIAEKTEKLRQAEQQAALLSGVESINQKRHMREDLAAKMASVLEDCDLLILLRTTIDPTQEMVLPSDIHSLDPQQIDVIKDFLARGKRLLVCVGPTVREGPARPDIKPDALEPMLTELGFKLGREAVLYDAQRAQLLAQDAGREILGGAIADVPPVLFDWKPGAGEHGLTLVKKKPQPIRESLRLLARGLGKEQPLDVKIYFPRTVEYIGGAKDEPAVFMRTEERATLEPYPFHLSDQPQNTGKKVTTDEGYYPIGAAADVTVPPTWSKSPTTAPRTTRVAVIGNGRLFVDEELNPAKERLLVDVCNWLVGRDDLLPRVGPDVWKYPRVTLEEREKELWHWSILVGLPALFAYFGLVVLMIRRLR